jgi:malonate-semialdehyde dehydrogenase (acetylating) / methylmalonate-semialdehyde dehydrogenase
MEAVNYCGFEPMRSKQEIPVISPLTGSSIGTCFVASADQIDQAVQSAQKAFEEWRFKSTRDRALLLMKFHSLVIENQQKLVDLICMEHGKTKQEALGEISKGLETVLFAISLSQQQNSIQEVSRGVVCQDQKRPLGVCVSIVPFNFPFMVPFWTIPICLVVGNTIVVKPSEKVPLTMSFVMTLFQKAGFPTGVINLIQGTASQVQALVDHPLVKAVTFVGTSHVAELISHRARLLNKRVLALGGAKNHLIAYPDCDIDMTSTDVCNSFLGCTGQRCMAASVLICVGEQKDLIAKIVEKAKMYQPGQDGKNAMGPVIDQPSKDKILAYINEAEKSGVSLLIDGRSWTQSGFWVGPTVLLHTNKTDKALHDEIFGPVLSIYIAKSKEEAIEIENNNPYGNAGMIC